MPRIEFLDSSDYALIEEIERTARTEVELNISTPLYYFVVKSTIHIVTDKDKITKIFACCALIEDDAENSMPEAITLTQGADFEVVNNSLIMHTHSIKNIPTVSGMEYFSDVQDNAKLIYRNFKAALNVSWEDCLYFKCLEPGYKYLDFSGCTKEDLSQNLDAVKKAWVQYSVRYPDPLKTLRVLDLEGNSFTAKVREPHQDRIIEALSKAYHDERECAIKDDFKKYFVID